MAGQGIASRNLTLRSHFGADRHPALSLATLHFALFKGNPSAGGVEPTATGSYARAAVTNNATLWGTISSSAVAVSNAAAIVWPATTGLYSITDPLDWVGVFDTASGGVLWYWQQLQTPITVTAAADQPRLPAGTLTLNQPE